MAVSKKAWRALVAGLAGAASLAAAPARADFDQGVDARTALEQARGSAKAEPGPAAPGDSSEPGVWVSIGRSDLMQPAWSASPLGAPVMTSARAAVFHISTDRLVELSRFMREKLGRDAGFFAHETRAEAEADLSAPPPSKGGPYTVDQPDVVRPLVARVKEVELRSTIETLAAIHNRFYQADTGAQASAWVQGRWQQLAGGLSGSGAVQVSHNWKQPSVILTIPGVETPEEIVVLGGHLDSITGYGSSTSRQPGADDNASGIAVVTEVVRVLSEGGFRPKRTIQIMGYAAEEVGLRGSKDIADRYAKQGKKVVGVLQLDMTNFKGSAADIYLIEDNVDPELTKFLGVLIDEYVGVSRSVTKCGYGCSDHASWTRSGYPASIAFESSMGEYNPNIHTDRDTLAGSGGNASHSVAFAKLAVAFAVELAKRAGSSPAGLGR